MDRVVGGYEGPFWPTPAVIRRHMPEEITGGPNWTAMPAAWKWDSRLPELRRLCRWDSTEDPLVALANALSRIAAADPWLIMRNAMVARAGAGTWEKFGDQYYPVYSVEAVFVARNLVMEAGRKVGVSVDLSALSLDRIDACTDEDVSPRDAPARASHAPEFF